MKAKSMKFAKAVVLLNEGNVLTQVGKNLNTISKVGEKIFSWKGIYDREATILEEKEIEGLFSGTKWVINL